MIILGIETSCDETAVSIVHASGDPKSLSFDVRANLVLSQVAMHAEYGGVFPALAKREHTAATTPLVEKALAEAKVATKIVARSETARRAAETKARGILHRDQELFKNILTLAEKGQPAIDAIAVTYGPGLEPALWVGLTAAQALGALWDIPVIPINHMEGHICSVLAGAGTHTSAGAKNTGHVAPVEFPALALLISGGHTELVLVRDWTEYEIIGETRDDAVGEAFDKVARMLGLPYPGGPEISRRAAELRAKSANTKAGSENPFTFPRPMLHSGDFNFSFSGLKTSVLYTLKKVIPTGEKPSEQVTSEIAEAFEDAVTDVLVDKTMKAAALHNVRSLIIAGGVVANKHIRATFETATKKAGITLFVPESHLSTDNAVMIAFCAYIRSLYGKTVTDLLKKEVVAIGNARLSK